MGLPNLSNLMPIGEMRYIQAHYESPEYRNPDTLIGELLTPYRRFDSFVRGKFFLSNLRKQPFYNYVLARTKYLDEIFLDAIYRPVTTIVNIGCGTDTRAYRFGHILKQKRISVLEYDQAQSIHIKEAIARKHWMTDHVKYAPIDLNEEKWEDFARLLDEKCQEPILVMLEGVSPYLESKSFEAFLRLLAKKLHKRSLLVYDFKLRGEADDFGKTEKVLNPFRLPAEPQLVRDFHRDLGFQLQTCELSAELSKRLLPSNAPTFVSDCLVQLSILN